MTIALNNESDLFHAAPMHVECELLSLVDGGGVPTRQCHQDFCPGLIELLDTVVDQLDVEQVIPCLQLSREHR